MQANEKASSKNDCNSINGINRDIKMRDAVEAVQIEWISNGILARYKGTDGPVCVYFLDINHFIRSDLGGAAERFTLSKEPKVGDKCVIYFGIADADSE